MESQPQKSEFRNNSENTHASRRHLSRVQMVMDNLFHRPHTDIDLMG